MTRGLIVFALCTILVLSCKPKTNIQKLEPTQLVPTQSIELSEQALDLGIRDTLDFGKMRQGEIITKSIKITNLDSKPMVLLRHVTSCGCVKVLYDRKPIATNESSVIEFQLDSKSLSGWQMKLMEFYFADKATPMKIYLEAEVE